MADERATPLNQGFDKWLQITDGGKLQTWNGVDTPTPIIGDDPLVTKTELDDKASLSLNHGYVSEYTSRVMQEGGTIQNGRRTAAPFISPTYEDAKMILNASGGLDIAEVDGRKVVNKIWDSSQEKENQEFAGSDRPEFHKTLDGFEQVAVEKEITNLISAGQAQQADDSQSDWLQSRITTLNYDTVFGKNVSRHQRTTSSSTSAIIASTYLPITGDTTNRQITWTFAVRNNGGVDNFNVEIRVDGGEEPLESTLQTNIQFGDEFQVYEINHTIEQSDRTGVQVIISANSTIAGETQTWDFVAGLHMPIESAYPLLFTEGTRLAPATEIKDALPETGTVAGKANFVRVPGQTVRIFNSTAGDTQLEESYLIILSSGDIQGFIYGSNGGVITQAFPFDIEANSRYEMEYAISFNADTIHIYLAIGDEKYIYSDSHQINDTSFKDIFIGSRSGGQYSSRFLIPHAKDNIVRTSIPEFEQLFNTLNT